MCPRVISFALVLAWGSVAFADEPKALPLYDDTTYNKGLAFSSNKKLNDWADMFPLAVSFDEAKAKAVRKARLDWQKANLVAAFDTAGNTSAAWAGKARAALEARAVLQAQSTRVNTPESYTLTAAIRSAVAAGCDDPLVVFLDARLRAVGKSANEIGVELKAGEAVFASKYPAVQKFWVAQDCYGRGTGLPGADGDSAAKVWKPRVLDQFRVVVGLHESNADALAIETAVMFEAAERDRGIPPADAHKALMEAVEAGKGSTYLRGVLDGHSGFRFHGPMGSTHLRGDAYLGVCGRLTRPQAPAESIARYYPSLLGNSRGSELVAALAPGFVST
jgi:hypothetical protein